jgi:hypothetical protein
MPLQDNDGCCKDEVKVVKVQADQLIAKLVKTDFSLSLPVEDVTASLLTLSFNTAQTATPVAHGPPLSKQDTYLQNCVFRI